MSNLWIVVPCYNEEEVLTETTRRLTDVLDRMERQQLIDQGQILYVDDGSRDSTWVLIQSQSKENAKVSGLKLAHNVGHQNALWAGLEYVSGRCDAAVSIDADLQDDVEAIVEMVKHYQSGTDIVYGVRKERKTDTFFKRNTALMFYRLIRSLGGDILYNHADFRLMSQRSIRALVSYPERNLFLRGIVRLVGFPSAEVYYNRSDRMAGESKYPFSKMLSFALEGITSFSVKPLRLILLLGFLFIFVSIGVIIYALIQYLHHATIEGWTSLLVSLWFIGGSILVSIGIIGEYIGKIYREVKRRPRYFIEDVIGEIKR